MYGIDMKYTVKTLLIKGLSQRAISRELGISRKTVKKYFDEFQNNSVITPTKINRNKILDVVSDDIQTLLSQGLTGVLIQEKLRTDKGVIVSYPTVSRFIKQFKVPEVYPTYCKTSRRRTGGFWLLG